MAQFKVVDADGHITESVDQVRPYLEGRYDAGKRWTGRGRYYSKDGWDRELGGRLGDRASTAKSWLDFMDRCDIETSYLYPTAGLSIGWVREPDFATALCKAYNDFLHEEFARASSRLKWVCLAPFQDPAEGAKEVRRAVTELGAVGVFAPAIGLRRPLGDREYHPIYAEAERLGVPITVHATVLPNCIFPGMPKRRIAQVMN